MYRTFEIRNFRCFKATKLTGLERINLFIGRNGVGKTALLEAIFLHSGAYNAELGVRVNAFRGVEVKVEFSPRAEVPWRWLFFDCNLSQKIELIATDEKEQTHIVQVQEPQKPELSLFPISWQTQSRPGSLAVASDVHALEFRYKQSGKEDKVSYFVVTPAGVSVQPTPLPSPPFPGIFIGARNRVPVAEDVQRFSRLVLDKREVDLLKALQIIEPRLKDVRIGLLGDSLAIFADIGAAHWLPLTMISDGAARLASIVLAIVDASGGVVLIDEIENGIHYSALKKMWRTIKKAAVLFDVQVFATTHSWECVTSAHEAFSSKESSPEEGQYDFAVHKLGRRDGDIVAAVLGREALAAAIETNLEVRNGDVGADGEV
ncbi:hypothetical protein A7Q09_05505 [Methylacidiphilum sp. Yel]|uniref:AAA family ATPase n=1 Tax=Methylacidiphilum sp. Yel TaxID=1847730 RepID=UPI00106D3844|nr:ATP-binding protein [Methylacidiphilum sp. Yel]TFE69348.1 hypothetical protein A7Q09_05505 [Methylacidiphilum sp. Yel]